MKKILKVTFGTILLVLIIIQFYQPERNSDNGKNYTSDFMSSYKVPEDVKEILQTSCYDCHSNNTNYVWYDYIQPARTLVEKHINNAKKELNFNEWGNYSNRKQERLLTSMITQIENKEMPIPSYVFMHREKKLSDIQIKVLTNWLKNPE